MPAGVDTEVLAEALGTKVHTPVRGSKRQHPRFGGHEQRTRFDGKIHADRTPSKKKTIGAIQELSEALGIEYIKTISESFDSSNIQGTNPVSAMVVYKDGKPERKNYRKYKIKTVEGSNEFATTQEVIRRRYSRLLREGRDMPDLILMDGGKVQVHAAKEVLEDELGLDIPVAGMVKDMKHKTSSLIFGEKDEIVELDPNSQAFHLVQRIQEEVHRFAVTFHRQVRGKNSFASQLDQIEGVGPKTRTKILKTFRR